MDLSLALNVISVHGVCVWSQYAIWQIGKSALAEVWARWVPCSVCVCVTSDLSLDHGWPLCPEHLHCLEDINHAFVAHSLKDDAEGDEDSGPAHASTGNT